MKINKKANQAINSLLSRQNYLVVQANDLAKAFGNLSGFDHKVLDYCFSLVSKNSKVDTDFSASSLDIIRHLGLSVSGTNYKRIVNAFHHLRANTALYLLKQYDNGTKGIVDTSLFAKVEYINDGTILFKFSSDVAPYIFQLKNHYYSFKLSELASIKSKYALILLKLWQANRLGKDTNTSISGTTEDWQGWFLGNNKRWSAGRFKRDAINVAINELDKKMPHNIFTLTTKKDGRKVIGYQLDISQT